MQHICGHHHMIKLIKITIKYIEGAYTTDKHNLIIWIPFLQVWSRWHSNSHPDYLSLNLHQVTFDYSTLEAYISKTKNDRNKQISDSESWHIEGFTWLWWGYNSTNNIHAQRDAQKHCFIYARTTLLRFETTQKLMKLETTYQMKVETTYLMKVETTYLMKVETTYLLKVETTFQMKVETTYPMKVETTYLMKVETTYLMRRFEMAALILLTTFRALFSWHKTTLFNCFLFASSTLVTSVIK